jgi:hypothetical protein
MVFFLLRRARGSDQITLGLLEKIGRNAPDLFADHLETMSPSAISKTIAANARLRSQVGEHDFQLLRATLRNQFIISLVVYGLCGVCFVVGAILYFLLQPRPVFGQQMIFRADDGGQAVVTGTAEVAYHEDSRSAIADTFVRAPGYTAIEPGLRALNLHLSCFALDFDEKKRSGFRYQYSSYQIEYSRKLVFQVGGHLDQVFQALIDHSRAPSDLKTVKTILGYRRRPRYRRTKRSAEWEVSVENLPMT